jgi:hypothetical protein
MKRGQLRESPEGSGYGTKLVRRPPDQNEQQVTCTLPVVWLDGWENWLLARRKASDVERVVVYILPPTLVLAQPGDEKNPFLPEYSDAVELDQYPSCQKGQVPP